MVVRPELRLLGLVVKANEHLVVVLCLVLVVLCIFLPSLPNDIRRSKPTQTQKTKNEPRPPPLGLLPHKTFLRRYAVPLMSIRPNRSNDALFSPPPNAHRLTKPKSTQIHLPGPNPKLLTSPPELLWERELVPLGAPRPFTSGTRTSRGSPFPLQR